MIVSPIFQPALTAEQNYKLKLGLGEYQKKFGQSCKQIIDQVMGFTLIIGELARSELAKANDPKKIALYFGLCQRVYYERETTYLKLPV